MAQNPVICTPENATTGVDNLPQAFTKLNTDIAALYTSVLPGTFTFATLPAANLYTGITAYTTDQGLMISNGVAWVPVTTGANTQSVVGIYVDFANALWTGITSLKAISPVNLTTRGGIGTLSSVDATGDYQITAGRARPKTASVGYAQFTAASQINEVVIDIAPLATGNFMTLAVGVETALATNMLHIGFSDTGFNALARITGAQQDNLMAGTWSEALKTDGSVEYTLRLIVQGDAFQIIGPNGETFAINDPRIRPMLGTKCFFENSTTNDAAVRRFYAMCENTSSIPNGYAGPRSLPTLATAPIPIVDSAQVVMAGGRGMTQITSIVGAFGSLGLKPVLNLGPQGTYSLFGTILAAISGGAGSFQCDQALPNGTYILDFSRNSGANAETVTVTGAAGTSSPYTISISGTFSGAHPASAPGVPDLVVNTFSISPSSLLGKFTGNSFRGLETNCDFYVGGAEAGKYLCLADPSDPNTVRMRWVQANEALLFDATGGKTSLMATGGFANGTPVTTGALGGPTSSYSIPIRQATTRLNPSAITTCTITFPAGNANMDGYELTILNAVNFLVTITPAGATVNGAPASLAQWAFAKFTWNQATTSWDRSG